jgi:hypothetical protein
MTPSDSLSTGNLYLASNCDYVNEWLKKETLVYYYLLSLRYSYKHPNIPYNSINFDVLYSWSIEYQSKLSNMMNPKDKMLQYSCSSKYNL